MANRREFTAKTRKAARARSGMVCEAAGAWYGLPDGKRCTANLAAGIEYDHYILDANSKDNSLENCRAVCPKCHSWKTRNRDTPTAAKTVRQQSMGLKTRPKQKIPSPPKQPRIATKQPVPPRALFERREDQAHTILGRNR